MLPILADAPLSEPIYEIYARRSSVLSSSDAGPEGV